MSSTTIQTVFNIEPYDNRTSWTRWVSRLEGAFKIFGVPEDKTVFYLLHYMGADPYDVLCDKLAPVQPCTKKYQELVDIMSKHFCPEPLEIAENYRFHLKKQGEGESIQDFVTNLRKLALNCKFGEYQPTALRNQLVFGLRSEKIQSRLLETKKLTLEKALDIAYGMELSAKDAAFLHKPTGTIGAVNLQRPAKKSTNNSKAKYFSKNTPNNFTKTTNNFKCFRCGASDHLANKCNKVNAVCSFCRIKGHLQSVCRKKNTNQNQVNYLDLLEINTITDNYNNKFRNKTMINLIIN